jgi:LCP family protein required for cell wall assembly
MLAALVFACLLTLVLVGRGLVSREASQPLGPTLPPYPTDAPVDTDTAQPAGNGSPTADSEPADRESPAVEPACGGPPVMTLLAVGADTTDSSYTGGLADFIRIVRVDFTAPGIAVLTIPRGLWVYIPGLDDSLASRLAAYYGPPLSSQGEEMGVIGAFGLANVSYFYGNLYQLPGRGPGVLAHTLYANFGLQVDHYVAVNMDAIVRIIDDLGGIDVEVPYEVRVGSMVFSPGIRHMSGIETLTYAREREADNDWYRSERQDYVLRALWQTLQKPHVVRAVPGFIDRFQDDVLTDLSPAQIASLACIASRVSSDEIRSFTITSSMVTPSTTSKGFAILLPHEFEIRGLATEFMAGQAGR